MQYNKCIYYNETRIRFIPKNFCTTCYLQNMYIKHSKITIVLAFSGIKVTIFRLVSLFLFVAKCSIVLDPKFGNFCGDIHDQVCKIVLTYIFIYYFNNQHIKTKLLETSLI